MRDEPRHVPAGHGSKLAAPVAWHIITGEYPPQIGGVSDYTFEVASALAARGDAVHVWCPHHPATAPAASGVVVHRALGAITPSDLQAVGEQLDRFPAPRRILVQWVPHGYGYKAMNLPFCWWLRKRSVLERDHVEIMLHEPYLAFRANSFRQSAAAFVHRVMTILLLRAAERVWMSIPGWEACWRPYAFGKKIPFQWLPIPSSIPVHQDASGVLAIRRRYADNGQCLIGHFGTCGSPITALLEPILEALVREPARQTVLLMGLGSEEFRTALIRKNPAMERLTRATGPLPAEDVSRHVSACDMLIQPYPDGVSSRRTSFMTALSHAKPVVTTSGRLSEDCWDGAALLAQAGDSAAFVELIRRLRDDAALRERYGRAGEALYRERFQVDRVVETLRAADRVA